MVLAAQYIRLIPVNTGAGSLQDDWKARDALGTDRGTVEALCSFQYLRTRGSVQHAEHGNLLTPCLRGWRSY